MKSLVLLFGFFLSSGLLGKVSKEGSGECSLFVIDQSLIHDGDRYNFGLEASHSKKDVYRYIDSNNYQKSGLRKVFLKISYQKNNSKKRYTYKKLELFSENGTTARSVTQSVFQASSFLGAFSFLLMGTNASYQNYFFSFFTENDHQNGYTHKGKGFYFRSLSSGCLEAVTQVDGHSLTFKQVLFEKGRFSYPILTDTPGIQFKLNDMPFIKRLIFL